MKVRRCWSAAGLCGLCLTLAFSAARAEPAPAEIQLGPAGGTDGNEFECEVCPPGCRVCAIRVNENKFVNAILVTYVDASGSKRDVECGNDAFGWWSDLYTVPDGVTLVGISGRAGGKYAFLHSIRFHFSDGSQTLRYGGSGGADEYRYFLPREGDHYVGRIGSLSGRSGKWLNAIGLVYSK